MCVQSGIGHGSDMSIDTPTHTDRFTEIVHLIAPKPLTEDATDINAVVARAAADGWLVELATALGHVARTRPVTQRPAFVFAPNADGIACPTCGKDGSLVLMDEVDRWWSVEGSEDGTLVMDGHFETGDDGGNEHLTCHWCGSEWSAPADVDFR
jgi:hypothetical protein